MRIVYRRGLEEMEDSLLLADASHEQHVGRADAVAVQGVPALGVLEDSRVDAVVNDSDNGSKMVVYESLRMVVTG